YGFWNQERLVLLEQQTFQLRQLTARYCAEQAHLSVRGRLSHHRAAVRVSELVLAVEKFERQVQGVIAGSHVVVLNAALAVRVPRVRFRAVQGVLRPLVRSGVFLVSHFYEDSSTTAGCADAERPLQLRLLHPLQELGTARLGGRRIRSRVGEEEQEVESGARLRRLVCRSLSAGCRSAGCRGAWC